MGEFELRWRQRFREYAHYEGDAAIAGWSSTGLGVRLRHFRRRWRPERSGQAWLDVGCGAGTYTAYLEEHNKRVLGLDYSLPSLKKARQRYTASRGWVAADVTALPLARDSADGALCFGVLQAVGESAGPVREIGRTVRPGGEIWIDGLNAWFPLNVFERWRRHLRGRPVHLRYESPRALVALLRREGVGDIKVYWVPILPGTWSRLQSLLESRVVEGFLARVPLLGAVLSHAFVVHGWKEDYG